MAEIDRGWIRCGGGAAVGKGGWVPLTRGNETLGYTERLNNSRRFATFLLVFCSNLGSRHVKSVLAFRELVDLVKNHVEDIKPVFQDVTEL